MTLNTSPSRESITPALANNNVHTKFGLSASPVPKIWLTPKFHKWVTWPRPWPLGIVVIPRLTLGTAHLCTKFDDSCFDVKRKNRSNLGDWGHSKSQQSHRQYKYLIQHRWLPTRLSQNLCPSCYVFKILRVICRKSLSYSTCIWCPLPVRGEPVNPVEYHQNLLHQKTRVPGLPSDADDMFSLFDRTLKGHSHAAWSGAVLVWKSTWFSMSKIIADTRK